MKGRPFIIRFAAFFLILVFSQKAGAGLFLHNLLHRSAINNQIPGQENEKGKETGYTCNCIDDFLMPFAGADAPVISQPSLNHFLPFIFFEDQIAFHTPVFSALRGPPAIVR
jgi:hypothetical protein